MLPISSALSPHTPVCWALRLWIWPGLGSTFIMSKHQTFILSHWNALAKFTCANQCQLQSLWDPTNIFFSFSSHASGYLINVQLKQNSKTWCKQMPDSHPESVISILSLKTEPELKMAKLGLHQGKQFTASYLLCKCSYTHNCKICIFMSKSAFLSVVSGPYLPACSLHSQFRKGGLKIQPQVSSTWLNRAMYFPYPSSCPSWHNQFPLSFTFLGKSYVGWSQAAGVKPSVLLKRAVILPRFTHTLNNSEQHSSVNPALSKALIAKLKVWSFISFKIYYTVLHIH